MTDARSIATESVRSFNARDHTAHRALYADDVVLEAPGGVRVVGGAAAEFAVAFLAAFPDGRNAVHDLVVEGDWCVQRFTFTGTHRGTLAGPGGGVEPTNRAVSLRVIEMLRARDGKIVEQHVYFDQLELLAQLGLRPSTGAAM
ncbi:ester cyclase [Streptomyces sp. NPDC007162]|uniref:ester cyclase n=1 Tax=Streptomyces sp. NPDC007162 TaxID=3156917 RepID=UPI0033F255F7